MVADHQSGGDQGGIIEHANAGTMSECQSVPRHYLVGLRGITRSVT
jgi:hypothetical protein